MDPNPKQSLRDQILAYIKERPVYETYADGLRDILKNACGDLCVAGLVDDRAKEITSFAEKAIRKRDRYPDPIRDLTDLCAARVVTDTEEEVQQVCRYIRDHFIIDEPNSEDKRALLSATEFSYLSVHFVVQLTEKVADAEMLAKIGPRKAEIQVRTGLQHVWASIAHDR